MANMDYLDFDLKIEGSADKGYHAEVVNSPAGQAEANFATPVSDLELENFVLRVGRARSIQRGVESPEAAAAKTFGQRLFTAVFTDDVRACLRSSMDQATQNGKGLRVRIHLSDAPDLANLPWEYLYNPTYSRFLTLSIESPVIRYLELPEPIRPLTVTPPLRILAMISSPSDYPQLDVQKEWANLQNALGDLEQRGIVKLERLDNANLATLQRYLRQGTYHVFHFVGHGGFDQQAGEDGGVLVFEDEMKRGRQVHGSDLGTLLHDHRSLRLAVLNACEGARTSSSAPFAGVAQRLVQQGVPAVIAMQFEISDDAAITFAHEFYGSIADGYPVDGALGEARKAIFAQGNALEWGTPVLYMRAPDGKIFDVAALPARPPAQPETTPAPARKIPESLVTPPPSSRGLPTPQTVSPESVAPAAATRGFPKWAIGGIAALIVLLVVCLVIFLNTGGSSPGSTANSSTPPAGAFGQAPDTTSLTPPLPPTAVAPDTVTAIPNQVTSVPPVTDLTGLWYLNIGVMRLTQNGTNVTGNYFDNVRSTNGTLDGTLQGTALNAKWTEGIPSGQLTLNLDKSGLFLSGESDKKVFWCGARDGTDFPNGCSFAGSWTTSVNKSYCIMSLTLNNNNVSGQDCNGQITGTVAYGPGTIYLSGRNAGVSGGDFLMYLADYNALQFRGSFDSGQYEWCGWRQNSSMPDPCFGK